MNLFDPVCGMTVTAESSVGTEMWEGETYGFCMPRCHEKFTADPAGVVASARERFPDHFAS
ncbi:MAG: YHS domain-containing protein, partial [Candidatus Neomarinimicrobiota bacterium]